MNILESVGFKTSESVDDKSLLQRITPTPNYKLNPNEQIAIYEAYQIFTSVNSTSELNCYVLFRRYNDWRSSLPVAYVIDCSRSSIDEHILKKDIARLHHSLWLNGNVSLLYVSWKNCLDIINLNVSSTPDDNNEVSYTYKIVKQITQELNDIEHYSSYRLLDGTFWEDEYIKSIFTDNKISYNILVNKIKKSDKTFNGKDNNILRKCLLTTLFIKYLEDRDVFNYSDNLFSKYSSNAKSYIDLLKNGKPNQIKNLFMELKKKFNGNIISLESSDELTDEIINKLIFVIEPKKDENGNWYLWNMYNFKYIPIEVLSYLYEYFAEDGKGAVFTPTILVNLLLDSIMPLDKITGKETVFDPTCGSGVFLVSAFRRLVYKNYILNNNQISIDSLQELLSNCIYGVELQNNATRVTCFSLYLSICHILQPEAIWNNLKFNNIFNKNIINCDFIKTESKKILDEMKVTRFDIIVGNPPFELEDRPEDVRKKETSFLILSRCLNEYLSDSGKLFMIQPHGFLYNQSNKNRKKILEEYCLKSIFDFSSIKNLFENVNAKCIALLITKDDKDDRHFINHITFRNTGYYRSKMFFELDYYDYNLVSQKNAEEHSYVWKANLFGGGRFFFLINKLSNMKTLETIISEFGKFREGFGIGKNDEIKEDAEWLSKLKSVSPSDLHTTFHNISQVEYELLTEVREKRFVRPRKIEIYKAPIFIVHEGIELMSTLSTKYDIAFSSRLMGLSVSNENENKLVEFAKSFNRNRKILSTLLKILSNYVTDQREVVYKYEILNIPFIDNEYSLLQWERELIDDIDLIIDYIQNGYISKLLSKNASENDISDYNDTFIRLMRVTYPNIEKCNTNDFSINGLTYQEYNFNGDNTALLTKNKDWLKELVDSVDYNYGSVLRTKRIIRIYDNYNFVIVKPSKLKYWVRSTAIRDVDMMLKDIRHGGVMYE